MLDFFQRVLSPNGIVCLATPEEKGFRHYRLDTPSKAVWLANKLCGEGKNVYFACGTLREKSIEINGKTKTRCRENILEMKSLFVDLDVGKADGYASQSDALRGLIKFTKDTGMPLPLVVSSGNGIHAYWPFTVPIPAEKWRVLAAYFKSLTDNCGLRADPARTADVASVLRVPGTNNIKQGVTKPVSIIAYKGEQPDTDPRVLLKIIDTACKQFNVKPSKPKATKPKEADDSGLGNFNVASRPADFKQMALKCQIVKKAFTDQAGTQEPIWWQTLNLIRHCENPREWAHEFSKRDTERYDHDKVEEQMDRHEAENVPPTHCTTLDKLTRGGCNGCEFRGKITTPVELGRAVVEAIDNPTMVIDHGNGETTTIELPKPPHPYMRTNTGALAVKQFDEDGNEVGAEVFYDYDIYPTKRMFDEVEQCELFYFTSKLPHDGWREYQVPAHYIYDDRKLLEVLGKAGVVVEKSRKDLMVGYMLGYIQALQRQQAADQIYSQFGWRSNDTEIVIGERCFSASGSKAVKITPQLSSIVKKFESKGDLNEWKKVANLYNRKGEEEFAFALMMGFGALLFKFTGYEGALYNMHGKSGAGKSTILKLIHSIYGVPTEKSVLDKDTTNAKLAIFGAYNNLPVTYDEITNITPENLSELVYALSNGRGKEALKQDRTLRSNTATWQLTGFSTSNAELVPMIFALKGGASGETYRIMERSLKPRDQVLLNESHVLFGPLEHNYGLAGAVIAEWLVNNTEEAKKLVKDAFSELCDLVKAQSPERFWCAMGATAVAGARMGKMLGLHSYDPDWIMAHAAKIIFDSRGVIVQEEKTPVDIVVEYMNINIQSTLVVRKADKTGIYLEVHKPTRGVLIRHDISAGKVFIDKHAFKEWTVTRGYSISAIMNYLTESHVLTSKHATKSLADGTEFATGRTPCFVVDSLHPLMSGVPRPVMPTIAEHTDALNPPGEVA